MTQITYVAGAALEAILEGGPPFPANLVTPVEQVDPELDAAKCRVWWDGAWYTVTVEFDFIGAPGDAE